ncbi:hypothetical protein OF83DRAFT_1165574 [Amylostereum chailletii]|nr:hypothetical protein OF83DRAFT_1165574 [Amylostereum chailletii]
MPNAWRAKAGDHLVKSVPLIVFMDDVSGNITRQWNKHHVIYTLNAWLPREMLGKEWAIRYVTSSPNLAPMELMDSFRQSVKDACEDGIITWDCKEREEIMLLPSTCFFAGDNPMQAEECSQAGLACNMFCQTCEVGGTKKFKASDEGYRTIFEEGNLRTPAATEEKIHHQLHTTSTGIRDMATSSVVKFIMQLGRKLRGEPLSKDDQNDRVGSSSDDLDNGEEGRTEADGEDRDRNTLGEPASSVECGHEHGHGEGQMSAEDASRYLEDALKEKLRTKDINPLIGMPGVDVYKDIPTEILHTVLLGVVKYFWGQTIFLVKKHARLAMFCARISSLDMQGLNAKQLSADYLCQYSGSLIGKHFKSLAQVMPFIIYDLVPKTVLNAWNVIGNLVVMLWHTKIDDTEVYLVCDFHQFSHLRLLD